MKPLATNEIAYRMFLEKYDENKRNIFDKREKFACALFSYQTKNGIEFRKAFTAPSFTPENEFFKIAPEEIKVFETK